MQEIDKKMNMSQVDNQLSKAYREEGVHGTPGFPMRVYWNDFSTYVAGQIPWHWHEELELCVITQGKVIFSLPGEEVCLTKGQGLFINANTLHHMIPGGEEAAYMFSVVVHPGMLGSDKGFLLSSRYVRPYVKDSSKPYYVLNGNRNYDEVSGNEQHSGEEQHNGNEQHSGEEQHNSKGQNRGEEQHNGEEKHNGRDQYSVREYALAEQTVLNLLREIYDVYEEKQYANEYRLHNMICEVWYNLIQIVWNNEPAGKAVKDTDSERLYLALNYIQDNYGTDISLEDICKAMAVGRSECCRLFKRNLQMSPISYLITYRINMAAVRLENSNDSITRIAMDHGFTDDSYFCKIFKRYMQVTPLEYRKQRSGKGSS